ncbi:MAG TPA: DNA primase [Steroidobacteraceae bacterium]|jgi:DNA primase|nr:DNA primase [Steroidobacteraceae bacterium]
MAGRIPQSFIDDLTARADIVELIGSRVELKKAGREYRACCPFHNEKTPSFWVSPVKQFYHCFGCGAHGTALGFLMEYDKLSFPEAIEELASRLGLDVPREAGGQPDTAGSTAPLYDMNLRVAKYFASVLPNDARAKEYVTKRGLTRETVDKFMIGFATNSWNEVLKRFGAKDADRKALSDCGLIIERERTDSRTLDRHYDRFRDRLMFPIRDSRGRVLAFGGRIIDAGEPKYLNSPETMLFHKGRELYGLFEVRQSRATLKRLLVVEGYMDVARLHQAGVNYAVATLGTATTPEHLRRVFKLVNEVVFCFDGDRAGRAAAWRALGNALPEARDGRQIRFLFLPEGHDPDSLVGEEGREAFEKRLDGSLPLSEYLASALAEQTDLGHADGRAQFAELARPLVTKVVPGVYRDLLIDRLAESIKLTSARLNQLWFNEVTDLAGNHLAGASRVSGSGFGASTTARLAPNRPRDGGGGRGLVTKAVKLVVHFPAIAGKVSGAQLTQLEMTDDPGSRFLFELLDQLQQDPAAHSAQLLERWRDRPEVVRMRALAGEEMLGLEESSAALDLIAAIETLALEPTLRRYDELLAKTDLNDDERQELKELNVAIHMAKSKTKPAA